VGPLSDCFNDGHNYGFADEEKIFNGENANCERFPYMASLRSYYDDHRCGAVLINRRALITAAHCVHEKDVRKTDATDMVTRNRLVHIGACRTNDRGGNRTQVSLKSRFRHGVTSPRCRSQLYFSIRFTVADTFFCLTSIFEHSTWTCSSPWKRS
ncbi:unnamed protein product, partial [Ostreobium quekettii]